MVAGRPIRRLVVEPVRYVTVTPRVEPAPAPAVAPVLKQPVAV
jgi:hypothetical protein